MVYPVSYTHLDVYKRQDENGLDKVAAMKTTYKKLGLACLIFDE